MAWRGRVEDLLYEGETVETGVDLAEDARVVVTSHRVLAFTPDLEGKNFRDVDRPNVEGLDTGARSDADHLSRGVKWVVIGVVMFGAGLVVDIESLIGDVSLTGTGAGGSIGIGGVLEGMQTVLDLLMQLPTILLLGGAVFLLAGLGMLALFTYTRDRTIVIEVAGGEDVHLPRPAADGAIERLREALGLADPTADAAGEGEGPAAAEDPLADPGGGSGGGSLGVEGGPEPTDEDGDGWASDDPWDEGREP